MIELVELQICLLGTFQVSWDFAPVPANAWRHPLSMRLLKLILLTRPETVTAADAVRLLGRGADPSQLETALADIQRVLDPGARVWRDEQDRLRFAPGPCCWIDVDALIRHYEAGVRAASRGEMLPAIMALQEADALYQGDLLEESQESWVLPHRKRLQALYTEILERLAEGHAVLARYQDAVGFCHKALAHDPLREATYQRMMVYYYYLGDLVGTESTYLACREALENAGRQVSEETENLWAGLSRSEIQAGPGAAVAATKEENKKKRR